MVIAAPIQASTNSIDFPSHKNRTKIYLLLADLLGISISWSVSFVAYGQKFEQGTVLIFAAFTGLILSGLYLADAYHSDTQISGLRAPGRIFIGGLMVAGVFACLMYLSDGLVLLPSVGRKFWLAALGSSMAWSASLRVYMAQWLRSNGRQGRWLILGFTPRTIDFAKEVCLKSPAASFVVVTKDIDAAESLKDFGITSVQDISELVNHSNRPWSGIITAGSSDEESLNSYSQTVMQMRLKGMPVYRLPDFYENLWFKLPTSWLYDDWFAFSSGFHLLPGSFGLRCKRFIDIAGSALALGILSPIFLLVGLAIKLDTPGPIFYSQMRSGLGGEPFRVYKFRSMRQDAEKLGAQWASERDPRITNVGYLLRLSRLDELPQLWNVLKGEMSLIGPRPERPEFDGKLTDEIPYYQVRYMVHPGITGWAQVMYPYGASVEDSYEKLSYDLYYIKNYSLWLDIAIVFKTIRVMLLGKGR